MRASRNLWLLSGFSAGLLLANLLTHSQLLVDTWQYLSAFITSQADIITTYGPPALVSFGIILALTVAFPIRRHCDAFISLLAAAAIFTIITSHQEVASRILNRLTKEKHS